MYFSYGTRNILDNREHSAERGMRMEKHIALFIASLSRGGSERVAVTLAGYLAKKGYKVSLVTQYQKENEFPLPEGVERYFSEITEEEKGGRLYNIFARLAKLRRIWKELDPDVVLSFIGKNNLMAILTTRGLGIPVAAAVRGEPSEEYASSLMMKAANLLFPLAAAVVLQTEKSKDYFSRRAVKHAVVLKNQLSETFLVPLYEGERKKRIVMVGRIDSNKNHEMGIRAFAALAERYPEYDLLILGEGDKRSELSKLVRDLKLEERIQLPGACSDVRDQIKDAEIFMLTSYSEGVPNTLLEAMAQGLACISTDCPSKGPAQIIKDGENGLLVPVGNVEALTEALGRLLGDTMLREQIANKGLSVRKEYAGETVNREWEDFLNGIARRK